MARMIGLIGALALCCVNLAYAQPPQDDAAAVKSASDAVAASEKWWANDAPKSFYGDAIFANVILAAKIVNAPLKTPLIKANVADKGAAALNHDLLYPPEGFKYGYLYAQIFGAKQDGNCESDNYSFTLGCQYYLGEHNLAGK